MPASGHAPIEGEAIPAKASAATGAHSALPAHLTASTMPVASDNAIGIHNGTRPPASIAP